jgi:hypothetical protein
VRIICPALSPTGYLNLIAVEPIGPQTAISPYSGAGRDVEGL